MRYTWGFAMRLRGYINVDGADPAGLNVEAVPVRYGADVVAVLTHRTALAATRTSSPLELFMSWVPLVLGVVFLGFVWWARRQ